MLAQGIVPVVPPLGFDGDGKTYRVNSDSVALSVAEALKATKLIYITTQDGLIHQGTLIRQDIATNRFELLKWSFLFWVGQVIAVVGLVGVMLRAIGPGR